MGSNADEPVLCHHWTVGKGSTQCTVVIIQSYTVVTVLCVNSSDFCEVPNQGKSSQSFSRYGQYVCITRCICMLLPEDL